MKGQPYIPKAPNSSCMFYNLEQAINNKQEVLNNKDAYWREEWVTVKHRKHNFWGIVDKPYYTSHTEMRFNHNLFNDHLAQVDQQINNCQSRINSTISSLSSTLYSLQRQNNQGNQKISSLQSQLERCKKEYDLATQKNIELNNTVELIRSKLVSLNSEIDQVQNKISTLQQQLSQQEVQIKQQQDSLVQAKNLNTNLNTQLQSLEKSIQDVLIKSTEQQKAFLLFNSFDKPNFKNVVSAIKSIGFDADHLAYLAIKQNHKSLLDLALEHGADCGAYACKDIGDKTLLQYACELGRHDLIDKILNAKSQNFECTLLNAVKQEDLSFIDKIFGYKNGELLHLKINGYTMLHFAISANKINAASKILALDNSTLKDLTESGESVVQLAIRSANLEILKHFNLEEEAKVFIQKDQIAWLEKLLATKTLSSEAKQNLMVEAVKNHKTLACSILADHGANKEVAEKVASNISDLVNGFEQQLNINDHDYQDNYTNLDIQFSGNTQINNIINFEDQ
jgi:hypothetical protein